MNGHGGIRPGAGRPHGARNKSTLAREGEAVTLSELARKETSFALGVLKEVASDAEQSGSARVSAAVALLDRAYGRPPQLTELAGGLDLKNDIPRDVRITLVAPDGAETTATRGEGE